MKKISCSTTFFYKKIFPVFFICLIFYVMIIGGTGKNGYPIFILFGICVITWYVFSLMHYKVFKLIDKVYDDGDSLLLINSGKDVRIPLQEIEEVSYGRWRPILPREPYVMLKLRQPTELGTEIYFRPAGDDLFSNEANTDIQDLIERIEQMR